jgi:hypothetical protein
MKTYQSLGLSLAVLLCAAPAVVAAPAGNGNGRATNTSTASAIERQARGKVIAVEPGGNPPTLTMNTTARGQATIVGVDVTSRTAIREGKAKKTLQDIASGNRVLLRWRRTGDHLVANQITILPHKS